MLSTASSTRASRSRADAVPALPPSAELSPAAPASPTAPPSPAFPLALPASPATAIEPPAPPPATQSSHAHGSGKACVWELSLPHASASCAPKTPLSSSGKRRRSLRIAPVGKALAPLLSNERPLALRFRRRERRLSSWLYRALLQALHH